MMLLLLFLIWLIVDYHLSNLTAAKSAVVPTADSSVLCVVKLSVRRGELDLSD